MAGWMVRHHQCWLFPNFPTNLNFPRLWEKFTPRKFSFAVSGESSSKFQLNRKLHRKKNFFTVFLKKEHICTWMKAIVGFLFSNWDRVSMPFPSGHCHFCISYLDISAAALLHIKGRLFDNIEGGEFFSQNIPNKVKAEKLRRWWIIVPVKFCR